MLKPKRCAFTLAEILLAVVIVGIIAGLVMPSLLKDMQAKARMSSLKSTLIGIDDTIHREIAQKRSEDINDLDIFRDPQEFLDKFNDAAEGDAFANSYKNYNGAAVNVDIPAARKLLKNGVGIGISNDSEHRISNIVIDLTAAEPPNTVGIDYFIAGMTWDEDINRGIHVGDVHGYVDGVLHVVGDEEGGAESVDGLRNSCLGGSAQSCFRLVEVVGYDHNYLNNL